MLNNPFDTKRCGQLDPIIDEIRPKKNGNDVGPKNCLWYNKSLRCISSMVLVLDGNAEIGATWHNGYLLCLRHLFISRAVINTISLLGKTCATCSDLPYNNSTMIPSLYGTVEKAED